MKIVVCIKQVPDTMDVRIDPVTNTLMRDGVPSILNPFDEFAIEEGLQIREKCGGSVTALTMGPPQADDILRTALAMGVDNVVLLSDRAFAGSDTLATSYALSKGIETIGDVDIVITGKQAIDGDTAQVGPGIASRLGFTQLTYVSKVEDINPDTRKITVERLLDGGRERVEAKLPALLAVVKDINVPRQPSILKMKKARNAEIPVWRADDIHADPALIGQNGSPTWVERIFSPEQKSGGEIFQGETDELAGRLSVLLLEMKLQ
ncbi:MAG: electron transfer flavoprotein subunit beta/FixA family protein [Candidatus Latescibacteria bacterium]|nr:electron transfer flavoprotein subunit beta/FixA family protein [Candidatus Latescibacterota bacterium]